MDDILRLTLLFDFYGELLTEKQKYIFEMYRLNDLSLADIAEDLNISRQAVRVQLKRTEKSLNAYEAKLNLLERFLRQKAEAIRIKELAEAIKSHSSDKTTLEYTAKIIDIADSISD